MMCVRSDDRDRSYADHEPVYTLNADSAASLGQSGHRHIAVAFREQLFARTVY